MENNTVKKAQRQEKQNVFNIADNARFKPSRRLSPPNTLPKDADKFSFTLTENSFGFFEGDKLICEPYTEESEVYNTTFVIDETHNKRSFTLAACAENIFAVVVAVQREVMR